MMGENLTLKMELGINAQRITQQFMTYNVDLQKQVEEAVTEALEELANEVNFKNIIKAKTKQEIIKIAEGAGWKWEMENTLRKKIEEQMGKKVDEYSAKIAAKLTKDLEL